MQERLGLSVAGWSEGALLTRVPSDVTVCTRPTRATTKILETSVMETASLGLSLIGEFFYQTLSPPETLWWKQAEATLLLMGAQCLF